MPLTQCKACSKFLDVKVLELNSFDVCIALQTIIKIITIINYVKKARNDLSVMQRQLRTFYFEVSLKVV